MSIKIQSLVKKYGRQTALNSVSFEVQKGEIIGLLGPNGAGKSTLMKSMVGLISPNEGDVIIDEVSVQNHPLTTKQKIGYLAENNPLYTEMYVKEYLEFVAQIRHLKKKAVDDVIEKVGLIPESNKKIKALSKGYKQRVGLAQAIIHQPEILILDEPTNGLDPNQIIEIREVIKEVGKNRTVLLSTHIMQEVEALCSRVILLNKGNKIFDQSITDFKGEYKSLEDAFYQLTQK